MAGTVGFGNQKSDEAGQRKLKFYYDKPLIFQFLRVAFLVPADTSLPLSFFI